MLSLQSIQQIRESSILCGMREVLEVRRSLVKLTIRLFGGKVAKAIWGRCIWFTE